MAFKHILCPVDFSDYSQVAVDALPGLVDRDVGRITLLHVVEVPVSYGGEFPAEFTRDLDQQAAKLLDRWAAQLATKVGRVETKLRVGHPANQILDALDVDPSIDLVVIGSHGRSGIKRMLLGSVAEKVSRHAPCPVFLARATPTRGA